MKAIAFVELDFASDTVRLVEHAALVKERWLVFLYV